MNWLEIKKEHYKTIENADNINRIHYVMFSPVDIQKDITEKDLNSNDTKVVFVRLEEKPTINQIRKMVENNIISYDKSKDVNKFKYLDYSFWFDKLTRLTLKHKFEVLNNNNESIGSVWFNNVCRNVNVTYMLNFLNELELYAMQCNDVTNNHLNEIKNINDIDELIRYDMTKDYPNYVEIPKEAFK